MMDEKGFSLLEVLASILIFGTVLATMAPAFVNHIRVNHKTELRDAAIAAAQRHLDGIRIEDPTTLPSSGTVTSTIVAGTRTFDVETTYCQQASYCVSPNNRHLAVAISFRGDSLYEVETVFTKLR